jgi:predicted nuclease of predicted toxin-antitoxin system
LREADDQSIWSRPCAQQEIIITKDEDFVFLAARTKAARVLWVRVGNAVNRILLARLNLAWPEIVAHLEEGASIVELR